MASYRYELSLRLWHPTVSPDHITVTLNLKPDIAYRKGDQRMTPRGNPLEGVWPSNYWHRDLVRVKDSATLDAADAIANAVSELEEHTEFLLSFERTGGKALLEIGASSDSPYAIELSPILLRRIASVGLGFSHHHFTVAQAWHDRENDDDARRHARHN